MIHCNIKNTHICICVCVYTRLLASGQSQRQAEGSGKTYLWKRLTGVQSGFGPLSIHVWKRAREALRCG